LHVLKTYRCESGYVRGVICRPFNATALYVHLQHTLLEFDSLIWNHFCGQHQ